MQEVSNEKKEKLNNQIQIAQDQINEKKKAINDIKLNNIDNYILLQVKIEEMYLIKDILLFNRVDTYKYYCNFKRDDIETIIDDKIVDIKYKIVTEKESEDNETQNENNIYPKYPKFEYYWNFIATRMHNFKITFK